MNLILAIMGADFDAQTERLLKYAVQVGLIRFCCVEHAELSDLVVDSIERRN